MRVVAARALAHVEGGVAVGRVELLLDRGVALQAHAGLVAAVIRSLSDPWGS